MLQTSRSYGAKIIFQYSMLHTFRGYGVEIIFQYSMLQTYCPYGAIINFIAYCLLPIALCAMLYAISRGTAYISSHFHMDKDHSFQP